MKLKAIEKLNMVVATVGFMTWLIYAAVWVKNGDPVGMKIGQYIIGAGIGWNFGYVVVQTFWPDKKEKERIENQNKKYARWRIP